VRHDEPMADADACATVRVAVVVPSYGQPWLTCEAVHTALAQRTNFAFAVIIVNDGCPFPETDEICRIIAAADPQRIFYLHKRNAGLSAARNSGIDFALGAFPDLEAVYFLDADNRIGPDLLQRLLDALRAAGPDIGWSYPDVDKFGFDQFGDTSGPYSPLEHLFRNICEAGSMASRRMLDAGIRFDTRMRHGVEDWEFWLQGLDQGFRGVHVPDAGFRYRRRGESMLVAAERNWEPILTHIRERHPGLFHPRAVLTAESEARSRYAVYHPDTNLVRCMSVPGDAELLSLDEYVVRLLRARERPAYGLCPGHVIVMAQSRFDTLTEQRLLQGVLWVLECGLRRATLVTCTLELSISRDKSLHWTSVRELPDERRRCLMPPDDASIIATTADALLSAADQGGGGFEGLTLQRCSSLHGLFLTLEAAVPSAIAVPAPVLPGFVHLCRTIAAVSEREHRSAWKSAPIDRYRAQAALPQHVYSELFDLPSVFPCGPDGGRQCAAIVVDDAEPETLATATRLSRELQECGWIVDLVTFGDRLVAAAASLAEFARIVQLPLAALQASAKPPNRPSYMGTPVVRLDGGEAGEALATLAAYLHVVSLADSLSHTLMGPLRRWKVVTWTLLGQYGSRRSKVDIVNACAAFEAAYDVIAVEDPDLLRLCRALAIPQAKLRLWADAELRSESGDVRRLFAPTSRMTREEVAA
jgi:hypothetical protein